MVKTLLIASLFGIASFYHSRFEGRKTASGETFHQSLMTAACNKYSLGTYVVVTNIQNGLQCIVKINDRIGSKRLIDLSLSAAKELKMTEKGITNVKIQPCR